MDGGCRFFTPLNISNELAIRAGDQDVVIDLYSGHGNLYNAFINNKLANQIIALDINPDMKGANTHNSDIILKTTDCLNVKNVKNAISEHSHKKLTFVLNPPFKRISPVQERTFWSQFDSSPVKHMTQRFECIAIASAIEAAPYGSIFYVIVPSLVLNSNTTSIFLGVLRDYYSMELLCEYQRARFGTAEVDVVVIKFEKIYRGKFKQLIIEENTEINDSSSSSKSDILSSSGIKIYRGTVRPVELREKQISAKDLKINGSKIIGNWRIKDIKINKLKNYSSSGDILIARVGIRMIGRIGLISKGHAITNESVITLRIQNTVLRKKLYKALQTEKFRDWCRSKVKGTANYFITKDDLADWVLEIAPQIDNGHDNS